jgi:hypothetical protein
MFEELGEPIVLNLEQERARAGLVEAADAIGNFFPGDIDVTQIHIILTPRPFAHWAAPASLARHTLSLLGRLEKRPDLKAERARLDSAWKGFTEALRDAR